jgi:polysaccharide export outer membrane protein
MELLPKRLRTPAHALRTFASLLLAAIAIAMAAPAAAQPQLADSRQSKEVLGAGDSVRVTVFQNPDLTTETRLSPGGSIVFPLIGEVALGGLTPAQAGSRIAEQLKRGRYIVNPQVAVAIVQVRSRQVHVLGQLLRPGTYVLEDTGSRLTDVLTLAGGISPTGSDTATILKRRGSKPERREINIPAIFNGGDPATNIEIESGDTIFVERAPVFYIYGEVQRAGAYRLEPNMIVMQALSLGGGLTARGTERGIGIHRRAAGGQFRKLEARLTDAVQADDIVFVRESLF